MNQGITSHVSQTPACQDKLQTFYDNLNTQLEQAAAPSPPSEVQDEHDIDVDVEMQQEGPISPPDVPMDVRVLYTPPPFPTDSDGLSLDPANSDRPSRQSVGLPTESVGLDQIPLLVRSKSGESPVKSP
jgi:hypothetical protein